MNSITKKLLEFIQWIPDVFMFIETGREVIDEIAGDTIRSSLIHFAEPNYLILNLEDVTNFLMEIQALCTHILVHKISNVITIGGDTAGSVDVDYLRKLLEDAIKNTRETAMHLSQVSVGTSEECPKVYCLDGDGSYYNFMRDLRQNHPITPEFVEIVNKQIVVVLDGRDNLTIDKHYLNELYKGYTYDVQMIKVLELVTEKEFLTYGQQATIPEREHIGITESLKELLRELKYIFDESLEV